MYENYDVTQSPGVPSINLDVSDVTADDVDATGADVTVSTVASESPIKPHETSDTEHVFGTDDDVNDNVASVSSLQPASVSEGKKRNFFSKLAASTPLSRSKHVPLPLPDAIEAQPHDDVTGNGSDAAMVKEFSPTSIETDKDTQALVEEDF